MGQTSLDDDELFGEAADDMRSDIEASLDAARESLPEPDAIWETDADNVVGVLNGLRSAMDPGDAAEHLRDAKKWYTMGQRADAFEDADDLADEIETVEDVLDEMDEVREDISDLAGTVPQLRGTLQEAHAAADADGDEAEEGDDAAADGDDDGPTPEDADGEAAETASDGGQPQGEEQATLDGDAEE
jgi:hypothetical protein